MSLRRSIPFWARKKPGGLPYTPPLDVYGANGYAAHGFRKLRTAYVGNSVRLKRDSNSDLLDVGFDSNGYIDTAAIESFGSGTIARVERFYDQSGNSNDWILGGGFGAIVYDSGGVGLQLESGFLVAVFPPGNNYYYNFTSGTTLNRANPRTVLYIGRVGAGAGFHIGTRANGNGWMFRKQTANNNQQVFNNGGTTISSTTAFGYTGLHIFNHTHTDTTNGSKIYRNNSLLVTGTVSGGVGDNTIYEIGRDSTAFFNGSFAEHIVWTANEDSDISAINTLCNDYYSIY